MPVKGLVRVDLDAATNVAITVSMMGSVEVELTVGGNVAIISKRH